MGVRFAIQGIVVKVQTPCFGTVKGYELTEIVAMLRCLIFLEKSLARGDSIRVCIVIKGIVNLIYTFICKIGL